MSVTLEATATQLKQIAQNGEGRLRLTRCLIEVLTPGLKHLHAFIKEALGRALQRPVMEIKQYLNSEPTLGRLSAQIIHDIGSLTSADWWINLAEVADCGAQKEILSKLVHKQIAQQEDLQVLRHRWMEHFIDDGGLNRLLNLMSKGRPENEKAPLLALTDAALRRPNIPSLSIEQKISWIHIQRRIIEQLLSQSWNDFEQSLKELVKLAPREISICLYWALLKCAQGEALEGMKGIDRAFQVNPSDPLLIRLNEDAKLWKVALTPSPTTLTGAQKAEAQWAGTMVTQELEAFQAERRAALAAQTSKQSLAHTKNLLQISPEDRVRWKLPTELLQALVDLGPERANVLLSQGLLGQIYQQLHGVRALIHSASQHYPEAPQIKVSERAVIDALRLLERGLKADEIPSAITGGAGVKIGRSVDSYQPEDSAISSLVNIHNEARVEESPPPLNEAPSGHAPTALLSALTPPPVSQDFIIDEPHSSSDQATYDFTIEPEVEDLSLVKRLMTHGEFAQAEHVLLKLLDKNPFDAIVHNNLGVLYFQLQHLGDAKTHLILSIECLPSYEDAWENLVELFASLGQVHHLLPLFRRFKLLVEGSETLKRLESLCGEFTPQGTMDLESPAIEGRPSLTLPLSGSFFISPSEHDNIADAISAPLDPNWSVEEQEEVSKRRTVAQQEYAEQLRSNLQEVFDDWLREEIPPPEPPRGIVAWVKGRLGIEEPVEEPPLPRSPFDQSVAHQLIQSISQKEGDTESVSEPSTSMPLPTRILPEDMHRVRNIAFSMLCVPSGSFRMGTDEAEFGASNERPAHTVLVTRPFQLGRVPVTQELYEAVLWRNPSDIKSPARPVVRVSWFDAVRFCNALSELEGLPPAYIISRGARPEVASIIDSKGYRLPTEAEWEYSSRATSKARYSGGDILSQVGWAQVEQLETVARKEHNTWGFYDMSGNVWEWCEDGLREYSSDIQIDPSGDMFPYMHTPSSRVIRGGSWCFEPDGARVGFRGRGAPGLRISSLGFRIARTL